MIESLESWLRELIDKEFEMLPSIDLPLLTLSYQYIIQRLLKSKIFFTFSNQKDFNSIGLDKSLISYHLTILINYKSHNFNSLRIYLGCNLFCSFYF